MAQQASPNVIGHSDDSRPQLIAHSRLVTRKPSSMVPSNKPIAAPGKSEIRKPNCEMKSRSDYYDEEISSIPFGFRVSDFVLSDCAAMLRTHFRSPRRH